MENSNNKEVLSKITTISSQDEGLKIKPKREYPFKAGNSFGKGRPKGSRNKASLLVDEIGEQNVESVYRKAVEKALDGDIAACKLILDRAAPPRRGSYVNFDFVPIRDIDGLIENADNAMKSLSEGGITDEDAKTIFSLLEARERMIERSILAKRIEEIESGLTSKFGGSI